MKNKITPLMKDTLRTIKKTLPRFLAIIAMTGLSAMVFVGLQACIPNLKETIVKRVKDNHIHDLRVHSYAGIREKDEEIINKLPGSNQVEYMSQEVFDVKDEEYSIKLITSSKNIDTPLVTKGRIPENASEILLDDKHRQDFGDQIGQKISFVNKNNQEDEKTLKLEEFSIVGYGKSVDYIGNSRSGSTSTGDYFAVVDSSVMNKKYPDYAIARLSVNKVQDISTNDFKLFETKNIKKIKKEFENRPEEVKKEILKDAYKKINEGKIKISDGKKQIEDGQKKLDESKDKLDKSKSKLDNSKIELQDSKALLDDTKIQLDEAKKELNENEKTLAQSKKKLDDGYAKLSSSKEKFESSKKELDDAKSKLDAGYKQIEYNEKLYHQKIKDATEKLSQAKKEIEIGQKRLNSAKEEYKKGLEQFKDEISKAKMVLDENKAKLDQAKLELDRGLVEFNTALDQINTNISKLERGINQIDQTIADLKSKIPEGITREIAQEQNLTEVLDLFDKIDELDAQKLKLESQLAQLNESKAQVLAGKPKLDQAQEQYDTGLKEYQAGLKEFEEKKSAGQKKLDDSKAQIDQAEQKINESKALLKDGPKKLEEEKRLGLKKLNKAKEEIETYQTKYDQGLKAYQKGLEEYKDAKKILDENNAKYVDGLAKFNKGRADYQEGLSKYEDGLAKYLQGQKVWEEGLAEYNKGLKEYEDGLKTFETEKEKAQKDIAKAEEDIKEIEKELDNINIPTYKVEGIYNNKSFNAYISQISSLNYMSLIFTAMFYLVAILVTLTTILRMVETERTQIGTLKALGYNQEKILGKFLLYGLLAAVVGSLLGSVIGQFVLMPPIVNAYVSPSNLDLIVHKINYLNPIIIIFASSLVVGLTIYFTIRRSLKEEPANLMRPKPPTEAKRTIFEKIPIIWNKLSFLNKVSIRNVVRHKLRIFMIILGVAGSFGLIAMAFGIQDSVKNVGPRQFGEVYKYKAQLIYDDEADDFNEFNKVLNSYISDKISIISEQASILTKEGFEQDITIKATNEVSSFLDFVKLRKRGSSKNFTLEDNKVILTEKLAMILNLSKGDTFKFIDSKGLEHSLEVQEITEQYFNHVAYMTKTTYKSTIDSKMDENSYLVKFKDNSVKNINHVKTEISKYEADLAFIPVSDLADTLKNLSDSLNVVILMIIGVSALLTFVVLYNLTNINISERFREIATIKVLGFRPNEVASYIFKENYILTVVGIIFGIGFAKIMHSIIVFSLSSESFLFDPAMNIKSFIWAGLAVIAFMSLVMVMAKREMNRINMVEALKDF